MSLNRSHLLSEILEQLSTVDTAPLRILTSFKILFIESSRISLLSTTRRSSTLDLDADSKSAAVDSSVLKIVVIP